MRLPSLLFSIIQFTKVDFWIVSILIVTLTIRQHKIFFMLLTVFQVFLADFGVLISKMLVFFSVTSSFLLFALQLCPYLHYKCSSSDFCICVLPKWAQKHLL